MSERAQILFMQTRLIRFASESIWTNKRTIIPNTTKRTASQSSFLTNVLLFSPIIPPEN